MTASERVDLATAAVGPRSMRLLIAGHDGPDRVAFELREQGAWAVVIRGSRATNKQSLLAAFADALQFPDYFGFNWAALVDSLGDLDWLPERPVVVIVSDADALLSEDEQDLAKGLSVISHALERFPYRSAEEPDVGPQQLAIILHATSEHEPELRDAIARAELELPVTDLRL